MADHKQFWVQNDANHNSNWLFLGMPGKMNKSNIPEWFRRNQILVECLGTSINILAIRITNGFGYGYSQFLIPWNSQSQGGGICTSKPMISRYCFITVSSTCDTKSAKEVYRQYAQIHIKRRTCEINLMHSIVIVQFHGAMAVASLSAQGFTP